MQHNQVEQDHNCDLQLTLFMNTKLEGVNFRTSFNYSIDPELNRIRKAKFSMHSIAVSLDKNDIEIKNKLDLYNNCIVTLLLLNGVPISTLT